MPEEWCGHNVAVNNTGRGAIFVDLRCYFTFTLFDFGEINVVFGDSHYIMSDFQAVNHDGQDPVYLVGIYFRVLEKFKL